MPSLAATLLAAALLPSTPTPGPQPPDDREAVVSTLRGYHLLWLERNRTRSPTSSGPPTSWRTNGRDRVLKG